MAEKLRVLVWDESPRHVPKEVYPEGLRFAIAGGLEDCDDGRLSVDVGHLEGPGQGVSEQVLNRTDVLMWWGHLFHRHVADETVTRIARRVRNDGMGFIALHSACHSKPFVELLGSPAHLKGGWRQDNQPEEIRVAAPRHPIAAGVSDFTLAAEEMYGAPFIVPPASVVVLQSYFPAGGEYFPSGMCWTVGEGIDPSFESGPGNGANQGEGRGRVFYFRPGHEAVPTFFDPNVRRVLYNAVLWAGKRA